MEDHNMRKWMRKGISLLLAMVMVLALVPTTIFTAYAAFTHSITLNSSGVLTGEITFGATASDKKVTVIAVPSFNYVDDSGLGDRNIASSVSLKPEDYMAGIQRQMPLKIYVDNFHT